MKIEINITEEQRMVLRDAVLTYGREAQIDMAIEECSELIQALCKYKRGKQHNVEEEVADVLIMMQQLYFMFKEGVIDNQFALKIERLKERLTT